MKKTILAIFAFVLFFVCAGAVQANQLAFTVESISGIISGGISDSLTGESLGYYKTATAPTTDSVSSMYGSAESRFDLTGVFATFSGGFGGPGGPTDIASVWANAAVSILFRPNFTGQGPLISANGALGTGTGETITDITDGSLVYSIGCLTEDDFTYAAWNPTHVYRFDAFTGAWAGIRDGMSDMAGPGGLYTDIFSTTVPEPATMLLLGLGLIGLTGVRRKIQK